MPVVAPAGSFVLAQAGADFVANPYPTLARLRVDEPICRQPDGSVLLSRYVDVFQVLTDPAIFSSDKRIDFQPKFGDGPLFEHHTQSLVFNDPPLHTRMRRLLAPFFSAQTLRRLESRVGLMVDGLLDRGADHTRIDIVSDFAVAIPLQLVGDLLGVPAGEREPLRRWASLILGALEPGLSPAARAAGDRAVLDFKAYLSELIAHKRRHRSSRDELDILWALIEAHDAGLGLSEDEIIHNSIFLLNAGHDTTTSLIANGFDLLLRHPHQLARLRDTPQLMRTAIEEMLRFESPLQFGNRRSVAPCTVGGVAFPAGTFFHVAIAGANRDPAVFTDPERFDVGRRPNRHLAFGHGAHFCAGNGLARMEAMLAFGRLIERFPDFARAGPTVRGARTRFRIVDSLPVALHGAGAN